MGTSIAIYQTMNEWDNADFSLLDEILVRFQNKAPQSFILPFIVEKVAYLKKTSLLNKPPNFFTLVNDKSVEVNLRDLVGKKTILIDFWASWCGPCRNEMPVYKTIYEKYRLKDFEILSISTDRSKEDWFKALGVLQLPWINVIDMPGTSSVAKTYGIVSLPTNFLIDKSGIVIKKDITSADLENYLKSL